MSRTIKAADEGGCEDGIDWDYVAYCKKLLAEDPQILSLEETRAMLRGVKGSFAEALAEERDRYG